MNQSRKLLLKMSCLCVASTFVVGFNASVSKASTISGEQSVAGISAILDQYYDSCDTASKSEITVQTLESSKAEYNYDNLGIAKVDNHLNIRKDPGEDKKIIGKLPKDAGCTIIEKADKGWVKIKSGKVTGYVKEEFLVTGEDAVKLAKKVGSLVATVTTETLNVREEASLLGKVVTSVPIEEELEVEDVTTEWVKVSIDRDNGYVARQYVELSYQLKKAVTVDESTTGATGTRASVISYAKQFLGNRYVWGGTSLTNGVDCSGYTQGVFRKFGISLPRTSREQARVGTTISSSQAQAGDLVFYGSGSYINHVAIALGNGQVIHASNARTGIKISNMYYRTPIKVVRVIK